MIMNNLSTSFHEEVIKVTEILNYIMKHNDLMFIKSKFPELWESLLDAYNLTD